VLINMMGYDVDFGHMEMISLLSSVTYAEKLVGYMAVSVMMTSSDPSISLVIQAIKTDLMSTQDPIQCLALCATANIGGKELADEVKEDAVRILFSRSIFPIVRKKAALCLMRLVRVNRDLVLDTAEWKNKLTPMLEEKNMGVVLSVVSLILGLADAAGKDATQYDGCTGHLLVLLTRLAVRKEAPEDYMYHSVACPWLQVKILRLLQHFPVPALERQRSALNELLLHILNKTEVTKSVNRNNAEHCVLFEAVALIIKQGELSLPEMRQKSIAHLSKFINIKEPNIRYLGLDHMAQMLDLEGCGDAIRKQQATIMFSLKDADISIRRRALGLLFALCNSELAVDLVKDLLDVLALADWQFRDELVLKIAILAERYSPRLEWFVDTVVRLIAIAGDNVSDDIWHRLVQVVTNHEELQQYAAARLYAAVEPATAHETAVKCGAYVLGEFGFKLVEGGGPDGGAPVGGAQQFAALHQHFSKCAPASKCILLSTYAKLQNLYPELRPIVQPIFEAHTSNLDPELQQRALEYLHLPDLPEVTLGAVLDSMPAFPERDSHLESKLKKLEVRCGGS
jgi:AP-2 complex subunit alpha